MKKHLYTICLGIGLNMVSLEWFSCPPAEREISKYHR